MRTYKLRFRSGDERVISQSEFARLNGRLNTANRNYARFICDDGEIFFIECIERMFPEGEVEPVVSNEPKAEKTQPTSDLELARKELEDELMAKSSCQHTCDQDLYKTDTKTGPRFFRLCSFCGGNRTRFIALKDLTDEEMLAAKDWSEKE